jgi:hypothetical protein
MQSQALGIVQLDQDIGARASMSASARDRDAGVCERLRLPDDLDTLGIEHVAPSNCRLDDNLVDHSCNAPRLHCRDAKSPWEMI